MRQIFASVARTRRWPQLSSAQKNVVLAHMVQWVDATVLCFNRKNKTLAAIITCSEECCVSSRSSMNWCDGFVLQWQGQDAGSICPGSRWLSTYYYKLAWWVAFARTMRLCQNALLSPALSAEGNLFESQTGQQFKVLLKKATARYAHQINVALICKPALILSFVEPWCLWCILGCKDGLQPGTLADGNWLVKQNQPLFFRASRIVVCIFACDVSCHCYCHWFLVSGTTASKPRVWVAHWVIPSRKWSAPKSVLLFYVCLL